MTSYTAQALEGFISDSNEIFRQFLIEHLDEYKEYAKKQSEMLHGQRMHMVSPPNQVVQSFAVNRYENLLDSLDKENKND